MTIEAIIFDMDGLLVDSEPCWDEARARMAKAAGKPWGRQDHLNVMGVSTEEWVQYMIHKLELTIPPEQVRSEILQQMAAIYKDAIPFRPYAVQTVRWAAQHFPVALASGSPRQLIDLVVHSPELDGCFKLVVSCDEVGAGKPDPAIYLETARRLNIAAANCVCVEDSAYGVRAGKRAGMYVVNVPDPKFPLAPDYAKDADLVLGSLKEFDQETILGLNSKNDNLEAAKRKK